MAKQIQAAQDLEKKSRTPSSTVATQNAPTPRPWFAVRDWIYADDELVAKSLVIENRISQANAELICRAVNSHDVLWPLLVEWRKAEVAHAAIQLGLREGDLNEAYNTVSDATRELRIAVDRIHHAAPSVPSANDNHLAAPVIP